MRAMSPTTSVATLWHLQGDDAFATPADRTGTWPLPELPGAYPSHARMLDRVPVLGMHAVSSHDAAPHRWTRRRASSSPSRPYCQMTTPATATAKANLPFGGVPLLAPRSSYHSASEAPSWAESPS
uniref:Uncharacterized protein n=1 Tax=Bactrocera latifrons TaxID=174628 RepID=A0A0K8UGQ8_BACLA